MSTPLPNQCLELNRKRELGTSESVEERHKKLSGPSLARRVFLSLSRNGQQLPPIRIVTVIRGRKRHPAKHLTRLCRANCHKVPPPLIPIAISVTRRQSRGRQQVANLYQ